MCGRYTLAKPGALLRERFALGEAVALEPRYNIAPGDDVAAVTTDATGMPRGEMLRWGLVPGWAQDPAVGFKMISARSETLAERPAYRGAFERFRCLIPADGFYEWQALDGRAKQPFHVTRGDGQPFAFAGLWSVWHRGEGDELRTCAVITTAAAGPMATIHTRMPVILEPDAEPAWLDSATPRGILEDVLRGIDPQRTHLRAVAPTVNDARHDAPDCLDDPPPPAEPVQGSLFA